MPKLPIFRPNEVHDLLRYYNVDEIEKSVQLNIALRSGWFKLTKKQDQVKQPIPKDRTSKAITQAEEDEVVQITEEAVANVEATIPSIVENYINNNPITPDGIYNQSYSAYDYTRVTTDYTIVSSDKMLAVFNTSDITITIPDINTFAADIGFETGAVEIEAVKATNGFSVTVVGAVPAQGINTSSIVVHNQNDGVVIYIDLVNKLYFLSPIAGSIPWRTTTSSGLITNPTITDDGFGNLTIGPATANLFVTSDYTGNIVRYTIAGNTFAIPVNTTRYITVRYNSGSPEYWMTDNNHDINESDIIPAVTVINDNNELHWRTFGNWGDGAINKQNQRLVYTRGHIRESGLSLSESATNVINISGGASWYGIRRFTPTPVSSDDCETITYFWYHASGVWTSNNTVTTYNNTQYDDGTDLQDLAGGQFTVNWIYRLIADDPNEKEIMYVLGNQAYATLSDAQASTVPEIPTIISSHCILVGRIVVEKNAVSGTVESAFNVTFAGGAVSDHNSLVNLQGGNGTDEFYHLTHAEYDEAVGLTTLGTTGLLAKTAPNTYATRTITAGSNRLLITNGNGVAGNPIIDVFRLVTTTAISLSLNATHDTVLVNNVANVTIALPTAVGISGKEYTIKKISSNSNLVTITPFGSETIDDDATLVIDSQYSCAVIASDGANWYII